MNYTEKNHQIQKDKRENTLEIKDTLGIDSRDEELEVDEGLEQIEHNPFS